MSGPERVGHGHGGVAVLMRFEMANEDSIH